jgi:hypothetical protein
MTASLILAALGSKAFWLLYVWLGSAWAASSLSERKGYGEKWGLGSGLLLSAVGVLIWLLVPAKPNSAWKHRRKPQQDDRSSSTV